MERGWDSNRGSEGDVSPSWGAYEGAGPLSRSVSSQASATSNAHPLRHSWRDESCRIVDRRAVTRQPYQRAMKFFAHEKVSLRDNVLKLGIGLNLVRATTAWPRGVCGEYGTSECRRAKTG